MSFELAGGGAVIVGDAIGNAHLAFARPDWPAAADQNPSQGAETRLNLLDDLADRRVPMVGFHLPGGGLGQVERREEAFEFVQLRE